MAIKYDLSAERATENTSREPLSHVYVLNSCPKVFWSHPLPPTPAVRVVNKTLIRREAPQHSL